MGDWESKLYIFIYWINIMYNLASDIQCWDNHIKLIALMNSKFQKSNNTKWAHFICINQSFAFKAYLNKWDQSWKLYLLNLVAMSPLLPFEPQQPAKLKINLARGWWHSTLVLHLLFTLFQQHTNKPPSIHFSNQVFFTQVKRALGLFKVRWGPLAQWGWPRC